MLGYDAHRFGRAVSDLWLLEDICDRAAQQTLDTGQVEDTKIQVLEGLKEVRALCVDTGLDGRVGPQIARCEADIDADNFHQIASHIYNLRERILDEVKERPYFPVPKVDSHFYEQQEPFGNDVATRFTASADEFKEAAKCLSLQRSTACVFHLMRGMEAAVQNLAGVLGITINSGTTWRQTTDRMDARIGAMLHATDAQKAEKQKWADARAQLHHLGSVQRNRTMHPDVSYTQDEARHIYASCEFFMKALARL